ncbi:unnamed protein product [Rotaria sp. Silwood1]|nr:unnamed protein product [Rotaria sp. Silwood1]CAF3607818.1 unnamed protein product [Rotaria sp. Silwood1]CAF4687470.1 unnamed protein product [Rotaria sp. Silwood1]CAF4779920.1 unnamed protein product [Rotaria sp. Silwood1]
MDIVFISDDENQAEFDKYFKEMPWKAIPFSERERSLKLGEIFKVESIPSLIVLSPSSDTLTSHGVEEVESLGIEALHLWSQGKSPFWMRTPNEGEPVWNNIVCTQCHMRPLVGRRYGCSHQECNINLCEACMSKNTHKHPLVEYLFPEHRYSLKQLFASVPYLLAPNNEGQLETNSLWKNGVKSIGLYFSAHWCPPCREFTPQLVKFYKEAQDSGHPFSLVFLSSDRDVTSFDEYRAEMPWPAVPFNSLAVLEDYFQCLGIPSLIVISTDGNILTRHGCNQVSRKGVEALKTWVKGEKLPRPPADEFEWSHISCDKCHMTSIIGQRYHCSTCSNYDLCSTCEKKGHEHPLQLIPQPNDDDDNEH